MIPRQARRIVALLASIVGLASMLTLTTAPAGATVNPPITVTTTDDCLSCGSLRDAIIEANGTSGIDDITFMVGTPATITLGSDLPTITGSLKIFGPGSANLTIDGASAHHAFTASSIPGEELTITGLTIANSVASDAQSNRGGAINSGYHSLIIDDVVAHSNSVTNSGPTDNLGGAIASLAAGNVEIRNSRFYDNSTQASTVPYMDRGGSLSIDAGGAVVIDNVAIDSSIATWEGAANINSQTSVTVEDSTFTSNSARSGSGAASFWGPNISVARSRFSTNHVLGRGIAGLYVSAYERLEVSDSRFEANGDDDDFVGGAQFGSPDITIDRVTADHNISSSVGGLYVQGPASISNSTVADNIGAGIVMNDQAPLSMPASMPASLTPQTPTRTGSSIHHTTVVRNSTDGIVASPPTCDTEFSPDSLGRLTVCSVDPSIVPFDPTVLDHVLSWGNGDGSDTTFDVSGSAIATWSMYATSTITITASTGTVTSGDPGLGSLVCVSDLLCAVPIALGGAAWNAGDPAFVPPPATDQLGSPRVVEIIDIGAYEQQDPTPPVEPVAPAFTG